MNRPAVSVIIPTYNRAHFVTEAVISVLNQTFTDLELLVYDDGSSDTTASVMRTLKQHYPSAPLKYIAANENRGPSFARNRAVERSQGELIAFLDSDDLWLKNKLKVQTAYMTEHASLICQTDEIWIRNGRRVNPMEKHAKPNGDIFRNCLELCVVSPSAVMMRRHIFEEAGGFDESLPACEDYDLWLKISAQYPVHLIPKKLVVKRGGHEDQLSRTVQCLDQYRIYSMENMLKQNALKPEQKAQLLNMLKTKCGIYAGGLRKRLKNEEAQYYEHLHEQYQH